MTTGENRTQQLRDAGVITAKELPREYEAVLAGLTPDEFEVIVAVKRRFDEAGRVSGVEPGEVGILP
jgi:hypothetical protein